jgi:ABC-type bacteriocin/lantibiotic exporter with double-glycine peptidase domain
MFRRLLERSLATTRTLTWGAIWSCFVGTRILVMYFGVSYIVKGSLNVSELLICCINLDDIIWTVRMLIDLVPELVKLMEPIERVAKTLGEEERWPRRNRLHASCGICVH